MSAALRRFDFYGGHLDRLVLRADLNLWALNIILGKLSARRTDVDVWELALLRLVHLAARDQYANRTHGESLSHTVHW